MNPPSTFWSLSTDQVLQQTHSTSAGLSRQDAKQRLSKYGANSLKQTHKSSAFILLLNQFKSPIIVILIFAAVLSIFLKDALDAIIRNRSGRSGTDQPTPPLGYALHPQFYVGLWLTQFCV